MFALACRTHLSVDNNSVGHGLHHTHALVVPESHPVDVRLDLCQPHDDADFRFHEICVHLRHQWLHHLDHCHCVIDADVHWAELAHFLVLLRHHYVHVDDAKRQYLIQSSIKTVLKKYFNRYSPFDAMCSLDVVTYH